MVLITLYLADKIVAKRKFLPSGGKNEFAVWRVLPATGPYWKTCNSCFYTRVLQCLKLLYTESMQNNLLSTPLHLKMKFKDFSRLRNPELYNLLDSGYAVYSHNDL